jgi:hypothetical protein
MGDKSVFIRSCTRREFARRRAVRSIVRAQYVLALAVVLAGAGAVLVIRGGL